MGEFRIFASKHFSERLGKRKTDLSLITKIHQAIAANPLQSIYKIFNDYSVIVFAVDYDKGEVKLITAYPAN